MCRCSCWSEMCQDRRVTLKGFGYTKNKYLFFFFKKKHYISLPGVSIITRQTGLTVWSLRVVSAVALARLVVTISSEWVTVAVALTWHTAATTSQG